MNLLMNATPEVPFIVFSFACNESASSKCLEISASRDIDVQWLTLPMMCTSNLEIAIKLHERAMRRGDSHVDKG